jgi:hypothetical protein
LLAIIFQFYSIVHYDQKAANEGCAVDFITNAEMATIEFKASVKDASTCITNKCADDQAKPTSGDTDDNMWVSTFAN